MANKNIITISIDSEFKKAIEIALKDAEYMKEGYYINDNYHIRDEENSERIQVVSENDIDEACEDRRNYDGFHCKSFFYEDIEYFFVLQ